MSLKHFLAITTILGSLAAMAACQASFQAGAGSSTTPSASPGAAGAPPAAAAPAAPVPAATASTAAAPPKATLAGGKVVVPGSLTFDSGQAILLSTTENEAILSDLKLFLDQSPNVTQVRIEGHTDNVGNADANIELSGQRALTIKKALIERGVVKERLLAVGFGDKKPIKDNASAEGRAQNQRIEFRVATWNGKNYLNQEPSGGGKPFE